MNFEDFIQTGEVKKQSVDKNLSSALVQESLERIEFVQRLIKGLENPKYIVENIYDAIRGLIEAKLAADGFKSYSHEATILYLKKFKEFTDAEIGFLDDLRKIRNKIKYYGTGVEKEKADKSARFLEKLVLKLKRLFEK